MRMRLFFVLATIACVGAPGVVAAQEPVDCGPKGEKHEIIKHKGEHSVPRPKAGRSMIASSSAALSIRAISRSSP